MMIHILIYKSRFLSLLLILLSMLSLSNAQQAPSMRLSAKPYGVVYQSSHHYPGTEYLLQDWPLGEILMTNGQRIKNLPINYNAYTDALMYEADSKIIIEVSKQHVQAFKIISPEGERSFRLFDLDRSSGKTNYNPEYLEVLYDGSNKLFAKRSLKINSMLTSDNPFGKSVYYSDDKYYALIRGERIMRPQKKTSYYEYYEKAVIKKIIYTNKLNLSNEEDLVLFLSELEKNEPLPEELASE